MLQCSWPCLQRSHCECYFHHQQTAPYIMHNAHINSRLYTLYIYVGLRRLENIKTLDVNNTAPVESTPMSVRSFFDCQTCEDVLNHGSRAITNWRFSVGRLWPWTLTLTSQKSWVKFVTDAEHLWQISWKSDLLFMGHHDERNEQTNRPTNKLAWSQFHNTPWRI